HLQRLASPGKQPTRRRPVAERGDYRQRRQAQESADVLGRADTVIEILEHRGETYAKAQRESKGQQYSLKAFWTNRHARRDGVIRDVDIVRGAGEDHVVLFRALQQAVQQSLICRDLLLDNVVIDRRFVLRSGSAALFFEGRAERAFALERLVIARLEHF